jgi:hypothetical protein
MDPANVSCIQHTMEHLSRVMATNPLEAHQMMYEVEKMDKSIGGNSGQTVPNNTMRLLQNRQDDQRRYNPQRCNEVAVIFTDDENVPKLQHVSILHKNLDALCYPILFPKSDQGW